VDVLFVDTGYHFAETIGTRDAVRQVYDVNVIDVRPSRTVEEQDRELGPRLFGRKPDLCCIRRKVGPLNRALEPYLAWISGIRRDESSSRARTKVVEWDAKRQMVKINPIASWTQEDVDAYITDNGVLINPLHYDNYPSIGCAPCTRQVLEGEAGEGRAPHSPVIPGRPVPVADGAGPDGPLVAVAHGSRDPRAAATVEALLDEVRLLRPGLPVRGAYLDHATPAPGQALHGLSEAVVLPLLLTEAYHSRVDLPAELREARARDPRLRVRYGTTLGPHPLLTTALERRLAE